jgi:hypothetical protein
MGGTIPRGQARGDPPMQGAQLPRLHRGQQRLADPVAHEGVPITAAMQQSALDRLGQSRPGVGRYDAGEQVRLESGPESRRRQHLAGQPAEAVDAGEDQPLR